MFTGNITWTQRRRGVSRPFLGAESKKRGEVFREFKSYIKGTGVPEELRMYSRGYFEEKKNSEIADFGVRRKSRDGVLRVKCRSKVQHVLISVIKH